jgi:hypothetical protein
MQNAQQPVEIFWTGGWDSTFRVLYLLLELRLPVAPIYLLDRTRASTQIEVETMDRIREALAETHPETRTLLLPTTMSEVADIAPDADIQAAGERLAQLGVGSQYPWLARYCKQHGKREIELCTEKAAHIHGAGVVLYDNMSGPLPSPHGYTTHRILPDAPNHDAYLIFGAVSFAMIDVSRPRMVEVARRNGWESLMGLTWFCHRAKRDRRPCGLCNPCINAIDEGFGWRIPRSRRVLSALYKSTLWPLRKAARKFVLRRRMTGSQA